MQTLAEIAADKAGPSDLQSALVAELLWLAEEYCVARDRLDVAIRLSAEGPVSLEAIDSHLPDEAEIQNRLEAHSNLYDALFSRLAQAAAKPGEG